jgi:uncharacterized protein YjfI (DUF2170 family)
MIQKPYNLSLKGQTVDGKESNIISWMVTGAIQSSFSIDIIRNSDNSSVWSLARTYSYSTKYTLPNNILTNGLEYKISVTVWDDKNTTATSDWEVFQTSSRPIVTLSSIGLVSSPSYNFQANYSQLESIGIKSFTVFLYDSKGNLVNTSGILTTSDISLSFIFSNLISEKTYQVEFQATSNKGLLGTSGKISFDVLYTQPTINVNLTAENTDDAGINISWNVIQIIGNTDCSPPLYINNNKIDLRNCRVWFSEGFSIVGNFSLKVWIDSLNSNVDILYLKGSNGEIRLTYRDDNRFHVTKTINKLKSEWVSSQVYGTNFFVCLQQINGNFNVIAEGN